MDDIYKKYSRIVYNYLYSLSNNIEISEELTQETFYRAIKGIENFRNECKINVWLCQIAKNLWINYIKKENRTKVIDFDENIENYFITDDINSKTDVIELYKEIHKLDEKTREVIYFRILGGLAFKEIGEIFGRSEEWARITFYRGKIKLKEELKND